MSSYWQAIERSAGLMRGGAQPRPRSYFEDEWSDDSGISDGMSVEEMTEVETPAPTIPSRPVRSHDEPRRDALAPSSPPENRPEPQQAPMRDDIASPAARNMAESRSIEPARPAESPQSLDTPQPPEAAPSHPPAVAAIGLPPHNVTTTPTISAIPMVQSAPLPAVPTLLPDRPEPRSRAEDMVAPVVATPVAARMIDLPDRPDMAMPDAISAPDPAPSLTIEIGEIIVRLLSDGGATPSPAPRAARPGNAPALGDFLTRRTADRH